MRLIKLSAQNFRTLEDIELPFAKDYCTISGANNAGKSCIIRLLRILFRGTAPISWMDDQFDYREDKTQWNKTNDPIVVRYTLEISQTDDPALIAFIAKSIGASVSQDPTRIQLAYNITSRNEITVSVDVNGMEADEQSASAIADRIGDANLMFLYNSTMGHEEVYLGPRGRHRFYQVFLSDREKRQLDDAAKQTERKLKRLARQNREELNSILGRLSEKYNVEFSPLYGFSTRRMPFGIILKDKAVEVPLNDWGSGTQNRTHILMAVLQANRIRTTESSQNKITPIVVVEEPESFLHPSAQAEFGKVLRTMSKELGIQIIVTTHSPYMLNQEEPEANILLRRQIKRGKALRTQRVNTSGEKWMEPFAEHLGIAPKEFVNSYPLFASHESKVLLVEGPIDKEYFEYLKRADLGIEPLSADIEVVPYGGKDTLKNTLLLKFVLSKFDNIFITYDLDCRQEVSSALDRLGFKYKRDHLALGVNKPGKDAIEGLLPEAVLAAVNGRETDLVMQLGSVNSHERRKAKDQLKKKYLEEFTRGSGFSAEDMKELNSVVKHINSRLAKRRSGRGQGS